MILVVFNMDYGFTIKGFHHVSCMSWRPHKEAVVHGFRAQDPMGGIDYRDYRDYRASPVAQPTAFRSSSWWCMCSQIPRSTFPCVQSRRLGAPVGDDTCGRSSKTVYPSVVEDSPGGCWLIWWFSWRLPWRFFRPVSSSLHWVANSMTCLCRLGACGFDYWPAPLSSSFWMLGWFPGRRSVGSSKSTENAVANGCIGFWTTHDTCWCSGAHVCGVIKIYTEEPSIEFFGHRSSSVDVIGIQPSLSAAPRKRIHVFQLRPKHWPKHMISHYIELDPTIDG